MTTRTRKHQLVYVRYNKRMAKEPCQFCVLTNKDSHVIRETKYFWIIKNIFPYDVWDTSGVKQHLLLFPKRHVDSIAHFNQEEQKEYISLLSEYEREGFSIYARAPSNTVKSVIHQHTHLITTDNKLKRFMFFVKKPRFLLTK